MQGIEATFDESNRSDEWGGMILDSGIGSDAESSNYLASSNADGDFEPNRTEDVHEYSTHVAPDHSRTVPEGSQTDQASTQQEAHLET